MRLIISFFILAFTAAGVFAEESIDLLWKYAAGGQLTAAPALSSEGDVYLYAEDRHIHALTSEGELRWKFRLPGRPAGALSVSPDGSIYACSEDGKLYALNPSGSLIWSFDAGGSPAGDPAVSADGTIYLALGDGRLIALSHLGRLRWSFDCGISLDRSPVVDSGTAIYLTGGSGVIVSCSPWGTENWRAETGASEGGLSGSVRAAVIDEHLLYTAGPSGITVRDSSGRLVRKFAGDSSPGALVMFGGGICALTARGSLAAYDRDGGLLWEKRDRRYEGYPAAGADGIYVRASSGQICLLSADGDLIGETSADGRLGDPALSSGMMICGSGEWIAWAFEAGGDSPGIWAQRGGDASHAGRTGERLFTFDEGLYRTNLDYVYMKSLLESGSESEREDALDEIAGRIAADRNGCGADYLLPLLYQAAGDGRLPMFRKGVQPAAGSPVLRARAAGLIAGIGNFESAAILAELLRKENDPLAAAALIEALGRLGTNYRGRSLSAVYEKVRAGRGAFGDERTAAAVVEAVRLITDYSGLPGPDYAYRILIEVYRGNYSRSVRKAAKELLRSMR